MQTQYGKGLIVREELEDGRPGPSSGVVLQPGTTVEIDPSFLMARMTSPEVSADEKARFFKQQACEVFGSAWNGIASKRAVGGRTYHYVRVFFHEPGSQKGQTPRTGLVSLEYLEAQDLFDCESLFKTVASQVAAQTVSQSATCNRDCVWDDSPITPLVRQWTDVLPELLPATEVSPGVDLIAKLESLCGNKTLASPQVETTIPVETSLKKTFEVPSRQFAVSADQVRAAHCLRTTPFSDEEIDREIDLLSRTSATRESKRVYGFELVDEHPFLIELFEKLTAKPVGGQAGSESPFLDSNCKNVRCAVREVFGDYLGPRLLVMLGKYGLNGSHLAFTNASPWEKDEVDTLLLGLSDFPSGALRVKANQQFTHYRRGSTPDSASPWTLANATINFFDYWNTYGAAERRMTVFHEMAHHISHQWVTHIDETELWRKKYPKHVYVSWYAMENPSEDLAESAVAYRYSPHELHRRNPAKYKFLKEVFFDGVEFTSEESCTGKTPRFVHTAHQLEARLQSEMSSPSPAMISRILQDCGIQLLKRVSEDYSLDRVDFEHSQSCIADSMVSYLLDGITVAADLRYPDLVRESLRNRLSHRPTDEVQVDRIIPEAMPRIAEQLEALVAEQDRSFSGYYENREKPVSQFCALWSRYIRISADSSGLESTLAPKVPYSELQVLQPIAIRVCELVHQGKTWRGRMKPEEISAAVDQLLGEF